MDDLLDMDVSINEKSMENIEDSTTNTTLDTNDLYIEKLTHIDNTLMSINTLCLVIALLSVFRWGYRKWQS